MVTLEPIDGYKNWDHDFWNSAVHDGTRAFLYASNLNDLRGAQSVENHVVCQNFAANGQMVTDLTCLAQPGENGEGYNQPDNCATTTTTAATTTTTIPTTTKDAVLGPTGILYSKIRFKGNLYITFKVKFRNS